MERLFAAPNGSRLVVIVVALITRGMLGWIPLLGGMIGFALALVILYQVAMIATNMIRTSPATS